MGAGDLYLYYGIGLSKMELINIINPDKYYNKDDDEEDFEIFDYKDDFEYKFRNKGLIGELQLKEQVLDFDKKKQNDIIFIYGYLIKQFPIFDNIDFSPNPDYNKNDIDLFRAIFNINKELRFYLIYIGD